MACLFLVSAVEMYFPLVYLRIFVVVPLYIGVIQKIYSDHPHLPAVMSTTEQLFVGPSNVALRSTVLFFHCRIVEALNHFPHHHPDQQQSRLRWKVGLYHEVVSAVFYHITPLATLTLARLL